MTAYAAQEDREQFLVAGMTAIVTKPLDGVTWSGRLPMPAKYLGAPGDESSNLRHNEVMKPEIAFIGLGVMGREIPNETAVYVVAEQEGSFR